jgi:hypothetical protein
MLLRMNQVLSAETPERSLPLQNKTGRLGVPRMVCGEDSFGTYSTRMLLKESTPCCQHQILVVTGCDRQRQVR